DEIPNDITRETPASFEPTIDYVVTKIPRFAFEKFPEASSELGIQMKSVGEAMAIGRTFRESLHKALRSLEVDSYGFEGRSLDLAELRERLARPGPDRLWLLAEGVRRGLDRGELHALTSIDPWFLEQVARCVAVEARFCAGELDLRAAKREGLSDRRLA